jgi:hypothetical protein
MLRKLRPVASMLGLDSRLLRVECEMGRLPIRVQRIGPRGLVFLNGADVDEYVRRINRGNP